MKDDFSTNSHYSSLIHFVLKGGENVPFDFGSERVGEAHKLTLIGARP